MSAVCSAARSVGDFDGRETLANFFCAFSICSRGTPPLPQHFAAAGAARRPAVDRQPIETELA